MDLLRRAALTQGVVAVTADESGRFTRFAISMQALQIPAGSRTRWLVGNDVAGNRNKVCAELGDEDQWLWFVDDDHTFPPDILTKLMARDVDVVAPICLRRVSPFLPVACVDDGFLDLSLYGKDELVEVQHTGSSGMLIRRHVIEALPEPWFELGNGISEDVNFCRAAVKAGFKIHVDLSCWLSHLTIAAVRAHWYEDRWLTGFDIADGAQLSIELGRP